MESVRLNVLHIDNDVTEITATITDLDEWLSEAHQIEANFVYNDELLEKICNQDSKQFEKNEFKYLGLNWHEDFDGKLVECEVLVFVCSSYKLADFILNETNQSFDTYVLDVLGTDDRDQAIQENAKVLSGRVTDPVKQVRILTAYPQELSLYLQDEFNDRDLELSEAKLPNSWGWTNIDDIFLNQILLPKAKQLNASGEDLIYRWLYTQIRSKGTDNVSK